MSVSADLDLPSTFTYMYVPVQYNNIIMICFSIQLFLDDTKVKNFITCFKGVCLNLNVYALFHENLPDHYYNYLDKKFLAFFFRRVKPNTSGQYQDEFPFVSPCGPEMNYIRCDDLPIVYTHMLDHDGQVIEDIETYGQTEPVIQSTNVLGNHGLTNLQDSLSQKVGTDCERDSKRSTNSLRVESVVERLSYGGTGNILSLPFKPEKLCMLPESGRVYHTGPEYLGGIGLVKSNLAIELSRFFVYSEGANESETPRAFKWRKRVYELDNSALTSKNHIKPKHTK